MSRSSVAEPTSQTSRSSQGQKEHRGGRALRLILAGALGLSLGCSGVPSSTLRPHSEGKGLARAEDVLARDQAERRAGEVRTAIHRSARYLKNAVTPSGRFVYLANLNPKAEVSADDYNLLRHAGAIYALASYQARWPSREVADALSRAVSYLRKSMGPVPRRRDLLAVWENQQRSEAKLGGAGLALVALASRERVAPGTTELDELSRLGAFVRFMQKDEGAFYSKYLSAAGGKSDAWTSLYYPGEAALGLLLLHELEPESQWQETAARALSYLAQRRRGQAQVESDHWALLATSKLYESWRGPFATNGSLPVEPSLLRSHAFQICESMLNEGQVLDSQSPVYGAFDDDGRTTPTATRLEGLTAVWPLLSDTGSPDLKRRARIAIDAGVDLLLRAQIREGRLAGGMPREVAPRIGESPLGSANHRATEVRIDYVQHALSAWLGYLSILEREAG